MSTPTAARPFPSYIPALDGLRGLAVLAVIVFHLAPHAMDSAYSAEVSHVVSFFRFGWVGVDLFFVLSGFLITGILYDNRRGASLLRAFYGRRLLRIFPLYYAGLAVYTAVIIVVAAPDATAAFFESLPWHAAYLTNIRVTIAGAWAAAPVHTSHLWSLAVEEQFYLLWPAIVLAAVKLSRSPRRTLIGICVLLVLVSIGFRLYLLPGYQLGAYTLLPARMDALAIGALVALCARGTEGVAPLLNLSGPVAAVCALALAGLALLSAGQWSYLHPLQQGLGYTLWAAFFASILIRSAGKENGRLARSLRLRPLLYVGRISYGLYLIHYPVIYVLDSVGMREFGFVLFCVAVFVASFLIATLSWRYLELPLLKLKRRLPYGNAADAYETASERVVQQAA